MIELFFCLDSYFTSLFIFKNDKIFSFEGYFLFKSE